MVKYKMQKMEKNMKQIMDDKLINYNHLEIFFPFWMMMKVMYKEKHMLLILNLHLFEKF
jgi:hypothetical protein